MRIVRFIRVGHLLHLMAIAGIFMFFGFGELALSALEAKSWWLVLVFGYFSLYGGSLPFFAELDARSRYQNYKLIKDRLHQKGYHNLLVKPFSQSRCQRDAVMVAAADLGLKSEVSSYFFSLGYRWYHVLPRLVLKNPYLLLSTSYWKNTLFVRTYKSQYFLW